MILRKLGTEQLSKPNGCKEVVKVVALAEKGWQEETIAVGARWA